MSLLTHLHWQRAQVIYDGREYVHVKKVTNTHMVHFHLGPKLRIYDVFSTLIYQDIAQWLALTINFFIPKCM